ncbi:MAG: glycosyl transferase family 36 [Phycisphaerales bacterium]|nr:glycosyl transferase family 36 [Phycisphaerales bacterium]
MPNSIIPPVSTATRAAAERVAPANPYGHFLAEGREYCITNPATPRPWVNIVGNQRMGFAVSQTGSGFTWIDNSQLGVITRWQQEFAHDASGKFIYARDADRDEVWSLTPAPCFVDFDNYACRNGLGYSVFETEYNNVASRWTMFCDPTDTVELWLVELTNNSDRARRIELCSFLEWNCGVSPSPRREFHKLFIETSFDPERGCIVARNHMWEVPTERHGHWNADFPYVSAFAATEPVQAAQGDKAAFLGKNRGFAAPAALTQDIWQPRFGRHDDPIAAMRHVIAIPAGESRKIGFVLAVSESNDDLGTLLDRYSNCAAIEKSLASAKADWSKRLSAHRIDTPDTGVNYLANDWLRYQAIVGRMWGRCGYYQQSGAFGFRDQLQDSQVWLTIDPAECRKQINLHAKHQFADGSVYHWWHPLSEQGHITRMTDDLLWLSFVTANYIRETGDTSVLQDATPFIDDAEPVALSEHIRRAFNRVFERTSPRGLPYIGAGDWNDGLSAAGLQEKGESIWLGHFLAGLLADWSHIHETLGDKALASDYRSRHDKLVSALNEHGWDGEWYMRATLDSGEKLGSHTARVGKIFLNAQTWAILNDIADASRAQQCWSSVCKHLVSEVGALLLSPAFDTSVADIGYITRYAPGMRENGGVYTHAATWAIAAAAKMRDSATVGKLLDAINPTNKDPQRYWAEPYVTPGNVDGPESPHFGRGGWTWYTGSAAWLHRIISEWVLGIRPTWKGLLIDPCLPPGWDEVTLTRPYRGCTYRIHIERADDASVGPDIELAIDGAGLPTNVLPAPRKPDETHDVRVRCR